MTTKIRNTGSIWAPFEVLEKEIAQKVPVIPKRRFSWVVNAIVPLSLCLAAGILILLPDSLPFQARIALWVFAFSIILWSVTKLNTAFVALAALVFLVLAGGAPQKALIDSLASDVIWLMIGAFILSEAIQITGLADRLTALVLKRARTVKGVFWELTFVLIFLTFFIPSTSGRAAVLLPVFKSLSAAANKRITKALSLLLPSVILVITISTLIGAGSHLIANNLLQQQTGQSISFLKWIIYGLPFGIAAAIITCQVILWMFLKPELRQQELKIEVKSKHRQFSKAEKKTLIIAATMVVLWTTESLHGIEIAVIAITGAVALMLPKLGVISFKQGVKSVSWELIIFIGAALMLSQALIDSGAAQWIIDHIFIFTGIVTAKSTFLILVLLIVISLTSHLYITSHTARAAALVPGLLFLAHSLHANPVAVLFIGTVGMDYCLTFPVSSKGLLMFQETDKENFQPADLLRLSAVMLTIHFILMIIFYFTYWRWTGLQLFN